MRRRRPSSETGSCGAMCLCLALTDAIQQLMMMLQLLMMLELLLMQPVCGYMRGAHFLPPARSTRHRTPVVQPCNLLLQAQLHSIPARTCVIVHAWWFVRICVQLQFLRFCFALLPVNRLQVPLQCLLRTGSCPVPKLMVLVPRYWTTPTPTLSS